MAEPAPVRVLYIAGAGRSGSTVLDTLLGGQAECESVGELAKLVAPVWLEAHFCACGERVPACPFWREVLVRWLGTVPGRAELVALSGELASFERVRSWPRLIAASGEPDGAFQRYAERTRGLYRAIAETSGKPVVVDSSKNPMRALALSLVPGLELTLIHLVRDARGLAWSYLKAFERDEAGGVQQAIAPQAVARTALGWLVANLASEWVRTRLPRERSQRVRYEDLVATPAVVLGSLGVTAGLDLAAVAHAVAAGEALPVGHTVAGNRLRRGGPVRLAGDWDWQRRLPGSRKILVGALAGWLQARYGYPWRAPRPGEQGGAIRGGP